MPVMPISGIDFIFGTGSPSCMGSIAATEAECNGPYGESHFLLTIFASRVNKFLIRDVRYCTSMHSVNDLFKFVG